MTAPLHGLRVLRIGDAAAGSLTAMLLADQGADAIHAVRGLPDPLPAGHATRTRGAQVFDLDAPGARERAVALAREADVLIDDGPSPLLDGAGLGPTVVRCSVPAFGGDDPRADGPSDDVLVAAASGVYHDPEARSATAPPVPTTLPLCATFAGLAAAVAVAAALVERERSGLGQRVEVAEADAAVLAIGAQGLLVDGRPAGDRPDDPWSGCFRCADGRWAMLCLTAPRFQERFLTATGREGWCALGFSDPARNRPGTAVRAQHEAALLALLATRTAEAWERTAAGAGFPLTMVRTRAEWARTEQARAAGLVVALDDPVLGALVQAGPGVVVGDLAAVRPRRLTEAPAWTGERWSVAPATAEAAPPEPTGPLAGLRVVDLTQVLAGPVVARTLAELGAEVVKVNDPNEQGPGYRWSEHRYHTDVNRGKATVLLDLKRPAGQAVLWTLAADADVMLQNFRPGVAERLGVGADVLAARRPAAILATVSAFGDRGPWHGRPGYESDAQAAAGMAAARDGHDEPVFETLTINDYATGQLGAFGVVVALLDRARSGRTPAVHASLCATASTLQLPLLERRGDSGSAPAPAADPAPRLYPARDGWVCLPAHSTAPDAAERAALAAGTRDEAVARLRRAGVAAQPVRSHREVMEDPRSVRRGLSVTRPDAAGAQITTVGPPARLSRSAVTPGRLVARPGHDAAALLAAAGLEDQLTPLLADGTIRLA